MILMSYFNRPILVKNALNSILLANEHHQNWELLFGDDGSKIAGKPIVEEILKDHLQKITFAQSGMTFDQKIANGLVLGKYCNEAIKKSNADIAIMLCDDDQIHPNYLKNLDEFFDNNPQIMYCYSKIHIYNPLLQDMKQISNLAERYNKWNAPINPANKVDASQVAWRLDCCKKNNAWFVESTKLTSDKPWIKDTDKSFFENLYEKCGDCFPTSFVSQYKAIHDYQLLWHKSGTESDLRIYNQKIEELAGVVF